MKFFSLDHLILTMTAVAITNAIMSGEYVLRFIGIGVVVYGILIINRRVTDLKKD